MSRYERPKIFQDVQTERQNVFRSRDARLNLRHSQVWRIPVTSTLQAVVLLWAFGALVLGSVTAPTNPSQTFAANTIAPPTSDAERKALEQQLKDLEAQIGEYEGQIVGYQKQGKTLTNEINTLNSKISKLNLQIKTITLTLSQLDQKITTTEQQIQDTETTLNSNRDALANLIRRYNESDRSNLVQIFLKNPRISDFFQEVNNNALLQDNIRSSILDIEVLQADLEEQRDQYSLARADAATLREYQLSQKLQTDSAKKQKDQLLSVTKGQEVKYQELLKVTKKSAAEIRSRIFQLLGGGELSFDQAYQLAQLASRATGVRAAFILAILDRESALGQNVGRCKYNQIVSLTGKPAMHPTRDVPPFLEITKELSIDPESVMVSCPNRDGTYGGAMGPAQFIPATWMIYKDAVAKATGNNPANPWRNADAFVATALYVKDAGAANADRAGERQAAAKYYAGGNWRRFLWSYGEAVVSRADSFQQDIDTLNE